MKDTKFFIEKSKTLISELEELNFDSTDGWLDNGDTTKSFKSRENNNELIGEVEFQIKLMFSEFDNGQLFFDKLENYRHFSYFGHEPKRTFLVDTLKTFIIYLEEYRVKINRVDIN